MSFANLIDIDPKKLKWAPQVMHQCLLRQLDQPNEDELLMKLGDKEIRFSKEELGLTSGLKCGGDSTKVIPSQCGKLKNTYIPK